MNVTVQARRWDRGWELWINGEPATQVPRLDRAVQQTRDYLDTIEPSIDHSAWSVTVEPDIGDLGEEVVAARAATDRAAAATRHAAAQSRSAAKRLREAGFSVADAASILGVTPGRVSQLVRQ